MIEDEELRSLFQAESEEHLQSLEHGLLSLERNPQEQAVLERLLRDAHSLKGAARILELTDIEYVAHKLEDILRQAHQDGVVLQALDINRLYTGIDVIKSLVREVLSGEDVGVNMDKVRALLAGEEVTFSEETGLPQAGEIEEPTPEEAVQEVPEKTPPANMPGIDDPELQALFKAESEEYLQSLEKGFLVLEKQPRDKGNLEELFRDAHSLKGAARMLGLADIERIAHRLEDILRKAHRHGMTLEEADIEGLYRGLDALKLLVDSVLTGRQVDVGVEQTLALINGGQPSPGDAQPAAPEPAAVSAAPTPGDMSPSRPAAEAARPEAAILSATAQAESFHIETIRVQPRQLDALMVHAGELSVTRTRVSRRLSEMTNLFDEWEAYDDLREEILQRLKETVVEADRTLEEMLGREQQRFAQLGSMLQQLHDGLNEDQSRLDAVATKIDEGVSSIRMLPLSTLFNQFPRMVRDITKQQGKEISLILEGGDTAVDKHILEELKGPLTHIIRNAIHHGIESPEERRETGKGAQGSIWLRGRQTASNVVVEVEDDGRGLSAEKIRQKAVQQKLFTAEELESMSSKQLHSLVFLSGFSTQDYITDISGRGVGMDVVRTNVERIKGHIQLDSSEGKGCTLRMVLPLTLATTHVLLVQLCDRVYGLPMEYVETITGVKYADIFPVEGNDTMLFQGDPVSVTPLASLLKMADCKPVGELKGASNCVIIRSGDDRLGLLVESIIDEQQVVIKPAGALLKRVPNVSGSCILATGDICMVLNPSDLLRSVWSQQRIVPLANEAEAEEGRQKTVLLAEDSVITRIQEKRILEGAGYLVIPAVDGAEALATLQEYEVDAVVSDINMPNLDGFSLTEKVRADRKYTDIPIVLVTTMSRDEDRQRGMEAGANAFISKGGFDQSVLLETLQRLLGDV